MKIANESSVAGKLFKAINLLVNELFVHAKSVNEPHDVKNCLPSVNEKTLKVADDAASVFNHTGNG